MTISLMMSEHMTETVATLANPVTCRKCTQVNYIIKQKGFPQLTLYLINGRTDENGRSGCACLMATEHAHVKPYNP